MDPDVINLAKAIRQAETGNRPVAGKSGELPSRYQFLPSTWKSWSKQYLGIDNAPITLENENKVAYSKIKELKDKGLNPAQIASVWNSGGPNWEGKVGVNKHGVKYDVPLYVNRVYSEYQKVKGGQQATGTSLRSQYQQAQEPREQTVEQQRANLQSQGMPVAKDPTRVNPTMGGMIARDILKTPAKILENVRAIPKILQGQSFEQATAPRESKYFGGTIAPLGTQGNFGQNLKESIGAGAELASYLPFGKAVTGTATALKAGSKTFGKEALKLAGRRIGANAVEGLVGTAMFEGGKRLQGENDRGSFGGALAYGTGGAVALGVLGAGLSRGIRQGRRTLASLGGKIPEDIAQESTQRLKGAWTGVVDNYKDLRTFRNKQAKYGRNIEDILTEEVMVPEILEGKIDTQKLLPEVDNRIKAQSIQLAEYAKKFDHLPVKIDEVQKIAEGVIRDTPSLTATGEYKTALGELDRRMAGLKDIYGETIVPSQLNVIRAEMNKITKAFGGDVFKQDVADAIADAVREKLDDVIQDDVFRRGNAKVGDLINIRKFLQKVDGKQVGGGRFSQAFAGIVGSIVGSEAKQAGLPVLGPVLGYLGGREISKQARQFAFGSAGPRTRAILRRMQRKNAIGQEIAEKSAKVEQKLLPARTSPVNKAYSTGKTIELPRRTASTVEKAEGATISLEKVKVGDIIKVENKEMEVTRKVADGVVAKDSNGVKKFIPKEQLGEQAFGAVAGIQQDEDGNLTFDKKSALAGVAGMAVAKKAGVLKSVKKASGDLIEEAKKYKSAEEFVKAQTEDFIKKWTTYDNIINRDSANLSTYDRLKNKITPEIYKELSKYKPKNPIELYRFQRKGTKTPILSSWSKDKEWVSDMAELPDMEFIKKTFHPDEILVDIEKIPSKNELTDIGEVIVKAKNYRNVSAETTKSQLTDIWNKANKSVALPTALPYKETGNLTTKILKDLEGKTTVSKQYILDATNRGELKQIERDLTREVLDTMPGDKIDVKEFADKVKSELLPLEAKTSGSSIQRNKTLEDYLMTPRYENISLPSELRGKIKDYRERIYNSPIETSAGKIHFGSNARDTAKNYFGHTRIEDMADNKTRRVIEVQSDLYQKGGLEGELTKGSIPYKKSADLPIEQMRNNGWSEEQIQKAIQDADGGNTKIIADNQKRIAKLQQYNDPTAHFRMVREEIKKAAQDGKTKLQFPTGETAMKIEGLGQGDNHWAYTVRGGKYGPEDFYLNDAILDGDKSVIGKEARRVVGRDNWGSLDRDDVWIITDVLGDGKFKAVPKANWESMEMAKKKGGIYDDEFIMNERMRTEESFDISGKVDTNNPIYKFYEKDVQKYLTKFGGKRVVDDKGVSWIEVPVKKEWAKMPVEAFALFPLFGIGGSKVITDNEEYTTTKSGLFGNRITITRKDIPALQPVEKPVLEKSRNVIIEKEDIDELKAILFGEISNRDTSKKELEVRTILNTVLNRVKQNRDRGTEKSVKEILTQKNQYQAYQGSQYNKYLEGALDDLGKKKKEELDQIMEKIIAEIEGGTFKDNTDGSVFYIHQPDGSITYRDGSLFK